MKENKERRAIWPVTYLVLGVSLLLVPVAFFMREMHIQAELGPKVESRIGCRITGPYIQAGDRHIEPIATTAIAPGGACDQAGFQLNDILIGERSLATVYQRLSAPSGKRVTFDVVPGGDGLPLDERPRRKVTIVLP